MRRCEKVWEDIKRKNKPLASKTFWRLSKNTFWSLESSLCNSLLKKLHFYHFWASWRELPFCGLPKVTNGSETYVLDHILEERGLKPRFWTQFWRKGVWNLGFGTFWTTFQITFLEARGLKPRFRTNRGLKPRFQTTFWRKGVWNKGFGSHFGGKRGLNWNLGFRPHFWGKGSETWVLDYILEERGLKPRFRTTFWREQGSEEKIYEDFNRKRAQKWRLLERS